MNGSVPPVSTIQLADCPLSLRCDFFLCQVYIHQTSVKTLLARCVSFAAEQKSPERIHQHSLSFQLTAKTTLDSRLGTTVVVHDCKVFLLRVTYIATVQCN